MSSVSRSPRPVSEKVLSLTPGFHRKFGKYIARQQLDIPEYAASLVNYKALKRVSSGPVFYSHSLWAGTCGSRNSSKADRTGILSK